MSEATLHGSVPNTASDSRGIAFLTTAVCVTLAAVLVFLLLVSGQGMQRDGDDTASQVSVMDKYDMYMTNAISNALEGVLAVEKVYWLSDRDIVAPEPDPACYGEAATAAELQWLLDEAADLIGDQEMLFCAETRVWPGEPIRYYLDESILVITWKQETPDSMLTISEVKISHPSQFRRFLADGTYGSDKQYTTTDMAASVNAVVASSGDFYKFRQYGTIVYNDALHRFEGHMVDTCFIDDRGDLNFVYRDEFQTREQAEQFVEENDIRFSLAFGPVLVDGGEVVRIRGYGLGEVNETYSRAALCQKGELHYLLVSSGAEGGRVLGQTINSFAKIISGFGVDKAYALDGGQTTVIAMNDEMINNVDFGTQRKISDIIYFATAMPEGD